MFFNSPWLCVPRNYTAEQQHFKFMPESRGLVMGKLILCFRWPDDSHSERHNQSKNLVCWYLRHPGSIQRWRVDIWRGPSLFGLLGPFIPACLDRSLRVSGEADQTLLWRPHLEFVKVASDVLLSLADVSQAALLNALCLTWVPFTSLTYVACK